MSPTYATGWRETVAPDEPERFARLGQVLATVQANSNALYGERARAVHREGHAGAFGEVAIRADLAEVLHPDLHVGPFLPGARWGCYARFSNGSLGRVRKDEPDVRGFALKLLGVPGNKLIGDAETVDFLFNQTPRTAIRTPEEFVTLIACAAPGGALATAWRFTQAVGLARAFVILKGFSTSTSARFSGFPASHFWSMLPFKLGPAAARFSLAPEVADGVVPASIRGDLATRLREGASWRIRVQLWSDPVETPIEDPTVDWPSPWVDVGTLSIPRTDLQSASGLAVSASVERLAFDPWHAVEEMRPLGAMNRARKAVYFAASAKNRDLWPENDVLPPPSPTDAGGF